MKKVATINFLVLVVFLFIGSTIVFGQKNYKRGYGFGGHSVADMEALSQGSSWWYNWWYKPDANNNIENVYQNYGMEFVPHVWSTNFNEADLRNYLNSHPDVKYIMGYNEPNFRAQANLTPAEAAAQWYKIEQIAADYNLKIVAPALNYSPDAPYHNPFDWMDDWLTECDKIGGCKFDFVNVHCYMNTVGALDWYIGEWERYGKPIWLTEFCAWDGIESSATPAYQQNFMREALEMLDNKPSVYRYAWFVGRSSGIPYNSLLAGSGQLTDLGKMFVGDNNIGTPAAPKPVTLRVVDRTMGNVTNSNQWPNQSVYCWLGDDQTWTGRNNMPNGVDGDWIGMYEGVSGGRLQKNSNEWIWSYTFTPEIGMTYHWNPGVWTNAQRSENSFKDMHSGENLIFTVGNNGVSNGELTLIIESAEKATSMGAYTPTSIGDNLLADGDFEIVPNPVDDIFEIISPWIIDKIEIYNLTGQIALTVNDASKVDVTALPKGYYVAKTYSNNRYKGAKNFLVK